MPLIFRFKPIYKTVLWGGERIASYKGVDTGQPHVGESWEISAVPGKESVVADGPCAGMSITSLIARYGAELMGKKVNARFGGQFPLLVKLIDAQLDLSVQVHPDDAMARRRHGCMGKNEMWYIIDTAPGALIGAGLRRSVRPDEFADLVTKGEVMDVVAMHRSQPGDVFYLPAGRIHTIGSGNLLAEIQLSSDITYRVYDFGRRDADGRLRELHVDLACEALDYRVHDDYVRHYDRSEPGPTPLVSTPEFDVSQVVVAGQPVVLGDVDSFRVVMCVAGEATLTAGTEQARLRQGQTALVAAAAGKVSLAGEQATLLTAAVPADMESA